MVLSKAEAMGEEGKASQSHIAMVGLARVPSTCSEKVEAPCAIQDEVSWKEMAYTEFFCSGYSVSFNLQDSSIALCFL